jgi:hypothetical protein
MVTVALASAAGCATRVATDGPGHAEPSSLAPRAAPPAAPTAVPAQSATAQITQVNRRVVTMTYLQAKPGRLKDLRDYIRANWFAMDEIAVQRGLMVNYQWLDTGEEAGLWNAVVVVTYVDDKGFAGIESQWAQIKAEHREVPVDGLRFQGLGRVVESKTFFAYPPFTAAH